MKVPDLRLFMYDLEEAFREAKKTDRSFERALHFRAAMLKLEEDLFLFLKSMENEE